MAQKFSLIYSFVARGTVILTEFTDSKGKFTSIAAEYLLKLPSSNNKITYMCHGHTFSYLVDNGFTYCVVAVDSDGWLTPMAFLERVKDDFNKRYGGGKAETAQANSLNTEFGSILKEHMQYCMDHPDEISKLAKVKAQQSEVKDAAMRKKIDEILSRETCCTLSCSSEPQVFIIPRRRKMWFQNMNMKVIVLAIIIALILIISLSVCGGFNSGK